MKLTRKLFIAIMTMALLVITFSASTFAWFTIGTESKVETVKVNVMAGAGMEISLDGKKWTNNITKDDLLTSDAIDLVDITSSNGLAFKKIGADGYEDATSANYLTLELFVRVTTTDDAVDFNGVMLSQVTGADIEFAENSDGATSSDDANQWLCDAAFTGKDNSDGNKAYAEGSYYNFDALNAVKISFQANEATTTKIFAYENDSNQGDVSLNGTAKAYATVKGYEVPDKFADNTTNVPSYIKDANLTAATANSATNDQKTAVTVLASTDFKSASEIITLYGAAASGTEGQEGYVPAGILNGVTLDTNYKYAKLTLRIWIEGWDADCINAILDQNTSFGFKLKAWKAAA